MAKKNDKKKKTAESKSSNATTTTTPKDTPKKKVQIAEEKNVQVEFEKGPEELEGYESYDDVEIDEEELREMIGDNEVPIETLNLNIVAGTYNHMLIGWNYTVETRLDFDHIVQGFMKDESAANNTNDEVDDNNDDEEMEKKSDQKKKSEKEQKKEEEEEKDSEEEDEDIDAMIDDDLEGTVDPITTSEGTQVLTPLFTVKAHSGSINCVASNGKLLASGGFDENISLFNLNNKKEAGVIHHTQGAITSLAVLDKYVFVGTAHGTLAVYFHNPTWPKVFETQAHANTYVKAISVHPTGKLVLTLGELDHRLRLWNMLNGTLLQTISLGMKTYVDIQWSPNGDSFAVLQKNTIEIYESESCGLVATLGDPKNNSDLFTCMKYLSEQTIAAGTLKGNIKIYNIQSASVQHDITGVHKSRIKGIDAEAVNIGEFALASVCSGGVLAVHRVTDEFVFLEGEQHTSVRFTCVTFKHDKAIEKFVADRYKEFEEWLEDNE